jgi:SAM-dependent methyltransferase
MDRQLSQPIRACRICEGEALTEILDLGAQPPANSLRRNLETALPAIPLVLCQCDACGTVQLTETVSPEYLFRDYVWVTGTSGVARAYSEAFRDNMLARCPAKKLSVLEVASNDGTFLQRFRERGHDVLGVDPAQNVAAMAADSGIPTIADFFGLDVARRVVADHGRSDAVFARNVIPHVADVHDVVAGMAHCLAEGGTGAIEFHRADVILEGLHYDSIYHEHLVYHSLHSIAVLLERAGLKPFDVTESPISGGSFVVYFAHAAHPLSAAYQAALDHERRLEINQARPWKEFARRCESHRTALRAKVEESKRQGKRLIGYGASARSSTMLNFCGIDRHYLDLLADRSPLKHDRYTPGTDVLIADPKVAFAGRPDTVLLLAWNFQEEILGQIKAEQGWTGEVIVPLPGEPKTVAVR